ncbi:MAG: hypothetical protein Q9194_003768, partial [Teloschistes cf. exilis]
AKIMLQREPRPGNQAIRRPPAKLPHEFRALRDARRSQRVTLRYQSAGGVNDAAASSVIISFAEKQSCSSHTRIASLASSNDATPASRNAVWAAYLVISKPMSEMALRLKTSGVSVARHCPLINTALSLNPGRAAKNASETTTAAAPPSEVGQHCSFVNGSWTVGLCIICSSV